MHTSYTCNIIVWLQLNKNVSEVRKWMLAGWVVLTTSLWKHVHMSAMLTCWCFGGIMFPSWFFICIKEPKFDGINTNKGDITRAMRLSSTGLCKLNMVENKTGTRHNLWDRWRPIWPYSTEVIYSGSNEDHDFEGDRTHQAGTGEM